MTELGLLLMLLSGGWLGARYITWRPFARPLPPFPAPPVCFRRTTTRIKRRPYKYIQAWVGGPEVYRLKRRRPRDMTIFIHALGFGVLYTVIGLVGWLIFR